MTALVMGTAAWGPRVGITGHGHALPAAVRKNDDPIFDALRQQDPNFGQYFNGYETRHVLAPGESIVPCMQSAAQQALQMAGLHVDDVDLLLGYASIGSAPMPNDLVQLHGLMGLSSRCWIVPVNNEYSNFNAALVMADALIRCGRARNALVVCGTNWTQHMNYLSSASVSAADGAGAAVLQQTQDASTFRVVDVETFTQTSVVTQAGQPATLTWGHMAMNADVAAGSYGPTAAVQLADARLFSQSYFHLDDIGMAEFKGFGISGPVTAAKNLLQRLALPASEVTVIAHQTSAYLLDQWQQQIGPHALLQTLSSFANMTAANIPVNLSFGYAQIQTDHVLLLSIGTELHSNAVLLRRNG
jgi:3-oxoacyl-[acyl-carrier-protein] synthase-3